MVYKAKRNQHETAEKTASKSVTTTVSGYTTTTVTKFLAEWSDFLGSGVKLGYRKIATRVIVKNSDGDVVSDTTTNSYAYTMDSGLLFDNVDGWRKVKDAAYTGTTLVKYNKLKGVYWQKELTKDTDTEVKVKMLYRTIDSIEILTLETVTEEVDGESYSYKAFVFDKSDDERQLIINEKYIYTIGSREYEIDLDSFTIEFDDTLGYFGFTITGGGTITLKPGETIKLYENGGLYRMTKNWYFGTDGTVCFPDGAVFNGNTGFFECDELTITDTADAAASNNVTIHPGEIHLELLSADVAVLANGEYYWFNGSSWVLATYSGGEVIYNGDVKLVITHVDGITYHALPNGIILGSDGSIELPATLGETAKLAETTATTGYLVNYIEGASVAITMLNVIGSLLDANDTVTPEVHNLNILASGDVLFKTASTGSVGTPTNPLEIIAGSVSFLNLDGQLILETDTYILVTDGDFALLGSPYTVSGCTLIVDVLNGNLSGNDLYVTNASTVDLNSAGSIIFNNVIVDLKSLLEMDAGTDIESATLYIDDSTVNYLSGGNITIPYVSAENGTVLTMDAAGDINSTELFVDPSSATLTAANIDIDIITVEDNSTLNMTADYNISNVTFIAADSQANLTAGGSITSTSVTLTNSTADFNAGADISTGTLSAEQSTLTMTAGGSISSTDVTFTDSTVNFDAGVDISTDMLSAAQSTLTMTAGGSISSTDVTFTDSTVNFGAGVDISTDMLSAAQSTLTMTAGGSISSTDVTFTDSAVNFDAGVDIISLTTSADASDITMTAGADIKAAAMSLTDTTADLSAGGSMPIDVLTAENSSTTMAAGGVIDITTLTLLDLNGVLDRRNTLNATAAGDITADTIFGADSDLSLTSTGGTITVPDVESYRSTLYMSAYGDLIFDIFDAYKSDVTLISTDANIFPTDEESYIKIHDELSSLTMSALGDIGMSSLHVRMDIPAEVILNILNVDDYYIDAMIIPVPDPPEDPVYTGTDEFGNEITNDGEIPNDYIQGIGAETLSDYFDDVSADEWAQRLMGVMTREEWLALIADGSVSDLIQNGVITAETLSEYLFDDTITPEELKAMLAVDQGTPEWQDTLDWLEDIETRLRTLLIDTQGLEPTKELPEIITDDMAQLLLALFIQQSVVGEIADPELILEPGEMANIVAHIMQRLSESSSLSEDAVNEAARVFNILVGLSTGSAYVTNEGDINITQQSGDMTVGFIDSFRGDVNLTSLDTATGSILGEAIGSTNIEARDICLSAAGSVGSALQPLVIDEITNRTIAVYNIKGMALTLSGMGTQEEPFVRAQIGTNVRYDWLRTYDCDEQARVDIDSGADVFVTEARGSFGVGIITAGGGVTLYVPASIFDVLEESETDRNITAASLNLTALGGAIGTALEYIKTEITGHTNAVSYGNMFITEAGDMDMTADSKAGEVNASAENDMVLGNTAGDLTLGLVTAGGFAWITADGSILEGERRGALATITADGMSLTAGAGIGTPDNTLEIDTGADTFSADCGNMNVTEISGDLKLKSVKALGDAVLTVDGSVIDVNSNAWNEAADAQKAADIAQSEATLAQTIASVLQDYADRIREEIEAADQLLADAQTAVAAQQIVVDDLKAQIAVETDESKKAGLEKQLVKEETLLEELEAQELEAAAFAADTHARLDAPLALAQAEADAAQLTADGLQATADIAQIIADQARLNASMMQTTMSIGGSLTITSGGSVGATGQALSMDVDGGVSIQTAETGEVSIASNKDLKMVKLYAGGLVRTVTLGSLINAAGSQDPVIKADVIDLSALGADIGQSTSYLYVCTDEINAMGENIYIHNCRDTIIGNIKAVNEAVIVINGSVEAKALPSGFILLNTVTYSNFVNVTAKKLTLIAKRNIGTKDSPLTIDVGELTAKGRHIYLANISYFLDILGLNGRSLHLDTAGNVNGKVKVTDIWVDAFGSIGTEEDPFGIYAPGSIRLSSQKGEVYYTNLFRRHYRQWQRRELETRYSIMFIMKVPFLLGTKNNNSQMALYIAVAMRIDGTWDILGIWIDNPGDDIMIGQTILGELFERGAEQIDYVYAEGIEGFEETALELYPDMVYLGCTILWLINNDIEIAEEDYEQLMADLGAVYYAKELDEALKAYEAFLSKWESKYPQVAENLRDSRQSIEMFYKVTMYLQLIDEDYDMVQLTDTMGGIIEYVGDIEYYNWDMLAVYRAFLQVLKYFPEY